MTYWTTDDDIYNDIHELSDMCSVPQPAPEPSEHMKRIRGKKSMFEDNPLDDEPQTYDEVCIPVRGHPLLKETLRRPGGSPSFTKGPQSDIREVAGFGYGNDLIESAIRANTDDILPGNMTNITFNSPTIIQNGNRKSDQESDSCTSSSECLWRSPYCSDMENGPDINNKKEFPELGKKKHRYLK